mmetsp:Transcript_24611/g.60844  ORF Transcript_24611/g.60844 Transcript_24611/m.60844 type:complete len:106 (+) Transcript_24611:97-414(+)
MVGANNTLTSAGGAMSNGLVTYFDQHRLQGPCGAEGLVDLTEQEVKILVADLQILHQCRRVMTTPELSREWARRMGEFLTRCSTVGVVKVRSVVTRVGAHLPPLE